MKIDKYHPKVIALQADNKITYHVCQREEDERNLVGKIVGKYPLAEYERNQAGIQAFHKQMLLKEKK